MNRDLTGRYGRYIPYVVCILAAAIFIAVFSSSPADREQGRDADIPGDSPLEVPDTSAGGVQDSGQPGTDPVSAGEKLSGRLAEILSGVEGVGRVRVEVTLDAGPRVSYHEETRSTDSDTAEADAEGGTREIVESTEERSLSVVRSSGGEEIPVVREVEPGQIRGVLVVAEGASDPRVRAELSGAVATLLDVGVHRVTVLVGKGGE